MSLSGPCVFLRLVFRVFLGFISRLTSLLWTETSDPRLKIRYETSDQCDVTPLNALPQICQTPEKFLDYIPELMTSFFSPTVSDDSKHTTCTV